MATVDEFRKFLSRFRCEKGQPATHTSIDAPKARLLVPDDRLPEFIKVYQHAMLNKVPLHLTEKPAPISCMRIDLDFRFVMPSAGTPLPRLYTREHVESILRAYYTILVSYLDAPTESFTAYLMEKPTPSEYRGKLKDGLHIIFPHLAVSAAFQHLVRKQIVDAALEIFAGMPLCNNYEDVVDEAIIEHSNWQMYGSCKPNCSTYAVTAVYEFDADSGEPSRLPPLSPTEELGLVDLLSMRSPREAVPYLSSKRDEVDQYTRHVLPTIDDRKKSNLHAQIFGKSTNKTVNHSPVDERQLARALTLECLKPDRAERYDDWIKVGWCLRNIDCELLDTFIEFSKVSSKYIEGECQNIWEKMRTDSLGMGTLRFWAKQDNLTRYNELVGASVLTLIDKCVGSEGAHFDVALVVHTMFKDKYRFTTNDTWYIYDERRHRWARSKEGLKLRSNLSRDVCSKFLERGCHWNQQSMLNDDTKDVCEDKFKKLAAIALKLKTSGYKESVMRECKGEFVDEKFESMLDSRPHLLGFENGVYDLRLHEFREGLPDDYISFGTGMHYFPYNPASPEAREIDAFFAQVFINENVRRYVKDLFATFIDGGIRHEKFYICTGSGSNGKSKIIELLQKAIGEYFCILPIALLTQKRAASNSAQSELERTKGRRFAVMQEPGENERLNIGLMKELTGGDTIQARGLFKEPIEFKPQFKMLLTCNELPEVPSDDGGTWRRIRVIEFLSKFADSPDPAKPNEFPVDIEISEKFERWAETFIAMLIAHHKTIDPRNITEPAEVRIATESYKSNNDIIGQYISEMIIPNPVKSKKGLLLNDLFTSFKAWVAKCAVKGKKVPDRAQLRAYMERLHGKYPNSPGWKGIMIKPAEGDDEDDDGGDDSAAAFRDEDNEVEEDESGVTNTVIVPQLKAVAPKPKVQK